MESWQLRQLQSLPLEAKVIRTQNRIREWYEHFDGGVYVSFSGGKDSTVLLHLVRDLYKEVPAVFVDTGLEFPEIKDFVRTISNHATVRPAMSFPEVIKKYGWPVISKEVADNLYLARQNIADGKFDTVRVKKMMGELLNSEGGKSRYNCSKYAFLLDAPFKVSGECCRIMKKNPAKAYEKQTGRKPFTGTMASESLLRRTSYLRQGGCNTFDGRKAKSNPLSIWTEQDVLQYLQIERLPIAGIYGDIVPCEGGLCTTGANRTGCMFCGFGAHLEKGKNRFQSMKQTHPKIHKYCMDTLCMREVLDYIGIPCE